jgi:glycolate oxidase FAD binding subunit
MILEPRSEVDVRDAVLDARARKAPLAIEGGGTKRGLGRPVQAAATLSLKHLTGITLYEPAEMVIGAWAGTPLAEVQKALDAKGQMLAFEPPDLRQLLGTTGEPTVGGMVAAGLAGPRRVMAGGLRDSLIGVRFVNGRGEIVKNGGRVMKNVTGLDLVKPQAGAHGTLGVLTEVIFKVVPKAPSEILIGLPDISEAEGIAALCRAMGSPFEPTGAAFVPAGPHAGVNYAYIRLEGFEDQLDYRFHALRERLGVKDTGWFPKEVSPVAWSELRDVRYLGDAPADAVWRLSLPPTKAVAAVAAIKARRTAKYVYDWSGGLIWLATPEDGDAGAALIHGVASEAGGHAMLVRGSEALRAGVDVFQPLPEAVMRIQRGLKASFDPDGILNPGRMYAGV